MINTDLSLGQNSISCMELVLVVILIENGKISAGVVTISLFVFLYLHLFELVSSPEEAHVSCTFVSSMQTF